MSEIKEKAARYRGLMADETFQELLSETKEKLVDVFLTPSAKIETIEEAHTIVKALDAIENTLNSVLDAEAVFDKKHNS
jgi:hypothetical protein